MKKYAFLAFSILIAQQSFASIIPSNKQDELCEKHTSPVTFAHQLRSKGLSRSEAYNLIISKFNEARKDKYGKSISFNHLLVSDSLNRFAYAATRFAYEDVPDWISESSVKDKFTDHCKENKPLYFN